MTAPERLHRVTAELDAAYARCVGEYFDGFTHPEDHDGVPAVIDVWAAPEHGTVTATVSGTNTRLEFTPQAAADLGRILIAEAGQFPDRRPVSARAAIEEAARDLDYRPEVAASILAAFPVPVQGENIPLAAIFDGAHPRFLECDELRALYAGHPAVKRVIDAAAGIEGRRATETDAEGFARTCSSPEPVNGSTDLSVPFPDRL